MKKTKLGQGLLKGLKEMTDDTSKKAEKNDTSKAHIEKPRARIKYQELQAQCEKLAAALRELELHCCDSRCDGANEDSEKTRKEALAEYEEFKKTR